MFTYSHVNTPLGQSERTYYLSYFISYYNSRQQYAFILQITTTFITIYDSLLITILDNCYHNLRFLSQFTTYHKLRQNAFSVKITDASKRSIKNLIVAISWRVLKFSCFSKCANKTRSQGFLSMPSSIERNVKI